MGNLYRKSSKFFRPIFEHEVSRLPQNRLAGSLFIDSNLWGNPNAIKILESNADIQRVSTDMTFRNPESESRIRFLKLFAGLFLGRSGKKALRKLSGIGFGILIRDSGRLRSCLRKRAVQRTLDTPSRGEFCTTPVSSKEEPLWIRYNIFLTCPLLAGACTYHIHHSVQLVRGGVVYVIRICTLGPLDISA